MACRLCSPGQSVASLAHSCHDEEGVRAAYRSKNTLITIAGTENCIENKILKLQKVVLLGTKRLSLSFRVAEQEAVL